MRKRSAETEKRRRSISPPLASFAPARLTAGIGTSQCPGVLTRGSQRRLLPSHIRQGCSGVCVEAPLPAYSGVTVWAFHPLRVVTGKTSLGGGVYITPAGVVEFLESRSRRSRRRVEASATSHRLPPTT